MYPPVLKKNVLSVFASGKQVPMTSTSESMDKNEEENSSLRKSRSFQNIKTKISYLPTLQNWKQIKQISTPQFYTKKISSNATSKKNSEVSESCEKEYNLISKYGKVTVMLTKQERNLLESRGSELEDSLSPEKLKERHVYGEEELKKPQKDEQIKDQLKNKNFLQFNKNVAFKNKRKRVRFQEDLKGYKSDGSPIRTFPSRENSPSKGHPNTSPSGDENPNLDTKLSPPQRLVNMKRINQLANPKNQNIDVKERLIQKLKKSPQRIKKRKFNFEEYIARGREGTQDQYIKELQSKEQAETFVNPLIEKIQLQLQKQKKENEESKIHKKSQSKNKNEKSKYERLSPLKKRMRRQEIKMLTEGITPVILTKKDKEPRQVKHQITKGKTIQEFRKLEEIAAVTIQSHFRQILTEKWYKRTKQRKKLGIHFSGLEIASNPFLRPFLGFFSLTENRMVVHNIQQSTLPAFSPFKKSLGSNLSVTPQRRAVQSKSIPNKRNSVVENKISLKKIKSQTEKTRRRELKKKILEKGASAFQKKGIHFSSSSEQSSFSIESSNEEIETKAENTFNMTDENPILNKNKTIKSSLLEKKNTEITKKIVRFQISPEIDFVKKNKTLVRSNTRKISPLKYSITNANQFNRRFSQKPELNTISEKKEKESKSQNPMKMRMFSKQALEAKAANLEEFNLFELNQLKRKTIYMNFAISSRIHYFSFKIEKAISNNSKISFSIPLVILCQRFGTICKFEINFEILKKMKPKNEDYFFNSIWPVMIPYLKKGIKRMKVFVYCLTNNIPKSKMKDMDDYHFINKDYNNYSQLILEDLLNRQSILDSFCQENKLEKPFAKKTKKKESQVKIFLADGLKKSKIPDSKQETDQKLNDDFKLSILQEWEKCKESKKSENAYNKLFIKKLVKGKNIIRTVSPLDNYSIEIASERIASIVRQLSLNRKINGYSLIPKNLKLSSLELMKSEHFVKVKQQITKLPSLSTKLLEAWGLLESMILFDGNKGESTNRLVNQHPEEELIQSFEKYLPQK